MTFTILALYLLIISTSLGFVGYMISQLFSLSTFDKGVLESK